MEEKVYVEEEIDLRDLFKSIWDRRVFILVFTAVLTILAIVYVNIKTPIYEVKSVVRIGYIGESLVESSNIIEKKLRLIFNVDNNPYLYLSKEEGIVTDIKAIKNVINFIEISTVAYTNEQALLKNKEVVSFLQNEYKYKIDEYVLRTELGLKNLEENIIYINDVDKVNLEKQIQIMKTQSIPRLDEEIDFLKNIELKSIENKILFNNTKLKEYENSIVQITKVKSKDNTQNMLMAMQLLNTQNLILNLQNLIENLNKEKENLIKIKLKELEDRKLNLVDESIRKLNIRLNIDLVNDIKKIENSIALEKLKLTNNYSKNSEIVGNIQVDDNPIKPKKALIIVVAFVTGFVLAIFMVFIMQFVSSMRKEK